MAATLMQWLFEAEDEALAEVRRNVLGVLCPPPPAIIGAPRSPQWWRVRQRWIENNGKCEACNNTHFLEVHHIQPYHKWPELELVESNLMTLCERCHFLFGHLCNWHSWNKDARQDAANFRKKVECRPVGEL